MSFLDRVRACNVFEPSDYVPFVVAGHAVGLVRPVFASTLVEFAGVFQIDDRGVSLADDLQTPEERTEAVDAALRRLAERGVIRHWRNESYPVATAFSEPPLFTMERAAVTLFGIRAHGLHVNGIVRDGDDIHMWIDRRSDDRAVAPGKLDQLVAGGQPAGLSLAENLVKECAEEADIPQALAETAMPVGTISYRTAWGDGLKRDVLFLYDLELPADFAPRNTDGELAGFELWPLARVAERVRDTDDFKFNCSLVIIDFLIRHGHLAPDHLDYLEIIAGLHSE